MNATLRSVNPFLVRHCERGEGNYKVERAILFGSRLGWKIDENSDADLIIGGEEFKGKGVLERSLSPHLE